MSSSRLAAGEKVGPYEVVALLGRGVMGEVYQARDTRLSRDVALKVLHGEIARDPARLRRFEQEAKATGALNHPNIVAVYDTAGYMSPEQARGLASDHRSDLFALGAVLFEMLTGRRAFKGTTPADTLSAILREDPTEGRSAVAELPSGLLRVVRRRLEKAPEDRFQSARDLAFALEGPTGETKEVKTVGAVTPAIGSGGGCSAWPRSCSTPASCSGRSGPPTARPRRFSA